LFNDWCMFEDSIIGQDDDCGRLMESIITISKFEALYCKVGVGHLVVCLVCKEYRDRAWLGIHILIGSVCTGGAMRKLCYLSYATGGSNTH
jgi:hypothetical protein